VNLILALGLAASAGGPIVVQAPEGPQAPETAWIAEAVADSLPRALALLDVPAVDRADLREAQEKLGIPSVPVTRATAIRVAETLGASRLVTGTYADKDETLTLSLRLLDLERATLSSPLIASGPTSTLADLVASLAWDVALAGPTRPLRSREEFLALWPRVPVEALQAYARGLALSDPVLAARQFRRALARYPAYDEARLALGRLQVKTREYPAALETLAKIGRASASSRTARFLEGIALLGLGRYAEANDLYAALAGDAAQAPVLNNRAVALLRLGSTNPRASALFRQAFEQDRTATDAMFNVGMALLVEGEPEAAAFWLRAVTERDPKDANAFLLLAWALRGAGRGPEGDEAFRLATVLQPSNEALATPDLTRRFERRRSSLGTPLHAEDDRDDATLAQGHLDRARSLLAAGKTDEALAEASRAAYLDPMGAQAHLCLARIHRARGERDEALVSFRMSLWAREDPAVRKEMGALLPAP
jgi:tetratricopeptide (TPR) repeat protein